MICCRWTSYNRSISVIPVKGNYIISCLDDYSRKVASRWSERKRSVDILNVLEDWIMINGKPKKIMHGNGKQFTSRIFKHFLVHNHIYDKRISNSYPQLQGRIDRSLQQDCKE
jgi:transposase InsO family protein